MNSALVGKGVGFFEPVAAGVARLGIVSLNVFAVGEPGGPWLLVGSGLAGSASLIRRVVARRFGVGRSRSRSC